MGLQESIFTYMYNELAWPIHVGIKIVYPFLHVHVGITKLRFKPAYNPYTEPSMEVFSYHEGESMTKPYLSLTPRSHSLALSVSLSLSFSPSFPFHFPPLSPSLSISLSKYITHLILCIIYRALANTQVSIIIMIHFCM